MNSTHKKWEIKQGGNHFDLKFISTDNMYQNSYPLCVDESTRWIPGIFCILSLRVRGYDRWNILIPVHSNTQLWGDYLSMLVRRFLQSRSWLTTWRSKEFTVAANTDLLLAIVFFFGWKFICHFSAEQQQPKISLCSQARYDQKLVVY